MNYIKNSSLTSSRNIINAIKNGELEEALDLAENYFFHKSLLIWQQIIINKHEFAFLKKCHLMGLVSMETVRIRQNYIVSNILQKILQFNLQHKCTSR